ncbi:MAG: ATP-grasp domain-containing protein [Propionibacterium sp.]|nr:ATP-grasp domain-containing protein [Propionibacterium sp.]
MPSVVDSPGPCRKPVRGARVLVTDTDSGAGRGVAGELFAAGAVVVRARATGHPLRPGPAAPILPPPHAPDYPAAMLALVEERNIDLVIPTHHDEALALAGVDPRIVTASPAALQLTHDRWLTHRALNQHGVAVPRCALPEELTEEVLSWVGTPAVISRRFGHGHPVRLTTEPHAAGELTAEELLCEFVPGPEFSVLLFLPDLDTTPVMVVLRTDRVVRGFAAAGNRVRRQDDADHIGEVALAAARALRMTGPVEIDIRLREGGRPVVLDVNAHIGRHVRHAPEVVAALLAHHHPGYSPLP